MLELARAVNPSDDKSDIVLFDRREDPDSSVYQPFVTWVESRFGPSFGERFWGHYFDNLEDAKEDFVNRAGLSKEKLR